jgi:hypothetical protein
LKKTGLAVLALFVVLPLITEIDVFLNELSMSETVKCLLEQDQGCRIAEEPVSIVFRQKIPDRACHACASFLVLQKPGVTAKLPVIPFALLPVDAVKWPGRFTKNPYQLVSLFVG